MLPETRAKLEPYTMHYMVESTERSCSAIVAYITSQAVEIVHLRDEVKRLREALRDELAVS